MMTGRSIILMRIAILVSVAVLAACCGQDMQVSATGEAIPVVYSLVNPDDSIHHLRIGRTFKSEGDAFDLARIPDSICYDTLHPKIEFYTSSGWKYHEIIFKPVQDFGKEDGPFTGDGIQLYECRSAISNYFITGTRLALNFTAGTNRQPVSATVEYVRPPRILRPKQGLHTILDFYPDPIDFTIEDPPEFKRYEMLARLHFKNLMTNGDVVIQTVEKEFIRDSENPGLPREHRGITAYVSGDLFLAKVRQDVKPDPDVAARIPIGMELVLHTGSREFYDYIDLNTMADDYGGQVVTNIIGGVGVFALRYESSVTNIFLGARSLDSLVYGRFTRHLKFTNY